LKTEEIVVIGAVGTAVNIAEQINDAFRNYAHHQKVIGFCIDSIPIGEYVNSIPVVCNTKNLNKYLDENGERKVIYCLFRPDLMKQRYELLESLDIDKGRVTNFYHPTSYLAPSIKIGIGNVILSNTTIQSNVSLLDFNIINSNVCIEHDTNLGIANFIAAGTKIGANALIKDYNFIGLNSSVKEEVSLDQVFVGMHSLVLSDFSKTRVFGIPAREK